MYGSRQAVIDPVVYLSDLQQVCLQPSLVNGTSVT